MGACGSKANKKFEGEGYALNAPKAGAPPATQHAGGASATIPMSDAPRVPAPVHSPGYRLGGSVAPGKQVDAPARPADASDPEERAKRIAAAEKRGKKDALAGRQVRAKAF